MKLPMPPTFAVGDTAWVYLSSPHEERFDGKVVAVVSLPGWSFPHYVVEIDTAMDPLVEIYTGGEMRREPDPGTLRAREERKRRLTDEAIRELNDEIADHERQLEELRAEVDTRMAERSCHSENSK
jgi:hypothetical protein